MRFDEASYLAANPDVSAAVLAGQFRSGREHYEMHGKREGRGLSKNPRRDKVFALLDKAGLGLEIGPSHNPVAPKKEGYRVHILDHTDAKGLREKYAGHNVNLDNIEEVDFVWSGQSLTELVAQESYYDWIIASHVVEHVPDLVSFLQQCQALLKSDGKLSLVVPDKRFCFDHFNPISSTGQILDAFNERRRKPSPGQVFDHFANASKRNGQIAWDASNKEPLDLVHSEQQAAQVWRTVSGSDAYVDVHCWRFIPESFRLIVGDLARLGLVGFRIIGEIDAAGCEFYVTLGKPPDLSAPHDRIKALEGLLHP